MPRFLVDENIIAEERRKLDRAHLPLHQIGIEVLEVRSDEEIIRYLQQENRVTFITRHVSDFHHRRHCHPRYCLLCLDMGPTEVAEIVLQALRHPLLATIAQRMGKVVRVSKEHL